MAANFNTNKSIHSWIFISKIRRLSRQERMACLKIWWVKIKSHRQISPRSKALRVESSWTRRFLTLKKRRLLLQSRTNNRSRHYLHQLLLKTTRVRKTINLKNLRSKLLKTKSSCLAKRSSQVKSTTNQAKKSKRLHLKRAKKSLNRSQRTFKKTLNKNHPKNKAHPKSKRSPRTLQSKRSSIPSRKRNHR